MDLNTLIESIEMYEGVIIDHGLYNIREMDEEVISFASSLGFELANDLNIQSESDEAIGLMAEDAIYFIQRRLPEGWWVGHVGEVGGFGIWRVED